MATSRRTLFIIIGSVLALILVVVLAIPLFLNADSFRPRIESTLSTATGRKVTLGKLDLSVLTGSVVAQSSSVADDPAFSGRIAAGRSFVIENNSGYVTPSYLHRLFDAVPNLNVATAVSTSHTTAADAALTSANTAANQAGVNATPSFLIGRAGGPLRLFQPSTLTAASFATEFNSLLGNGH